MSQKQKTGGKQRRRKKKYRLKKRFFVFLLAVALCLGGMVRCTAKQWAKEDKKEKAQIVEDRENEAGQKSDNASSISRKALQTTEPWKLRLVNSFHKLPEDFSVATTIIRGEEKSGRSFDSRAVERLNQMLEDSRAAGLEVMVCSAYRTVEYQRKLISEQVERYVQRGMSREEAKRQTATEIIEPGASEHNLGLAVDLVSASYQELSPKQTDTAENKWLLENCTKYGFILRYPQGKQEITQIIYEPWHFRYVGEEAAKEIMEQGLCLEEYLGEIPSEGATAG